jgi:Fe(3+) dicitrate transport protein
MYISDQITIGKTSVLLGLRMEDIESRRVDYGKSDPNRATSPKISAVSYDEVMPSVGITYQISDTLQILGGVYKGFSPTSVKSAIFEESTNSEFGFRYIGSGVSLSAIAFMSDYENLTGTCTASTGCAGDIGDSFSAGEAEVSGLEVSAAWLFDLGGIQAPVSVAYTYQETEFSDSFKSGYGLWGEVESGDEFAYMPENVLNINVGLRSDNWGMDATFNFKDKMRTSGGSGYDPYQIEDRTLIDLSGYYSATSEIDLTINIQNLFDEEYSVSWHPAGKRPGKPQTVLVGIRAAF